MFSGLRFDQIISSMSAVLEIYWIIIKYQKLFNSKYEEHFVNFIQSCKNLLLTVLEKNNYYKSLPVIYKYQVHSSQMYLLCPFWRESTVTYSNVSNIRKCSKKHPIENLMEASQQ